MTLPQGYLGVGRDMSEGEQGIKHKLKHDYYANVIVYASYTKKLAAEFLVFDYK